MRSDVQVVGKKRKIFSEDNIFDFINKALLCFFSFLVAYPVLYVFFASVSSGWAVDTGQVTFFPVNFTVAAYREVLGNMVFWRSYANSVGMTTIGSTFSMIIALPGAYALSKKHVPGNRVFNFALMFTMWFNAGMIPIYLNLQSLNLLNFAGLVIGFGVLPFAIIILKSAFLSLPAELNEAAKIDGANEFQSFFRISVPCIKPAIVTVWLMYAISRWNAFFWAMLVIREERWMLLQVYLRRMIIERETQIEAAEFFALAGHSHQTIIYAIIVCSMIPILIVFPLMQKVFKKGIMEGGLKG